MRFPLYLMLILALIACEKSKVKTSSPVPSSNGNTELIFGHYYGMCFGDECVEVFKLQDSALFEDTMDQYNGAGPYAFIKLSAAKFDSTKYLINAIPSQLLAMPDSTFGCPDCYDQGGLYVQFNKGGNVQIWRFDQNKPAVPAAFHGFMKDINDKIDLLSK